jgi:integrase
MSACEQVPIETTVEVTEPEVIVRVALTHARAIDDYLASCRARGWAESSIRNYGSTLYRFLDRVPEDLDVSKTTIEDLRRYQAARQLKIGRNTLAGEEARLASYFGWLYRNRLIARDPMQFLDRTKRIDPDDLDVTDLESVDVQRFLLAAKPGAELNAIAILAYLGPRRHAVSQLKLSDYDRGRGLMRFREKGSKTIWKPVPDELAGILEASIIRGEIWEPPADYLVPPQHYLRRADQRDDRVIWRLVRKVADDVGIRANVHAFRRAFAVFYLQHNPDDVVGLKDLLGHRNLETTMRYLRKRDKQEGMKRVKSLSWGIPMVEPEDTNELVEPLASGGGRIRTSVGSPRGTTERIAGNIVVVPPFEEEE